MMKRKFLPIALIMALAVAVCGLVACAPDSQEEKKPPVTLEIAFDVETGTASWNSVENAKEYEVTLFADWIGQNTNKTEETNYRFATMRAGDARITVRAVDGDGKELTVGNKAVKLDKSIGLAPAPEGLNYESGAISFSGVENASKYRLKITDIASNRGTFVDEEITSTSYEKALTPGMYEIFVAAVTNNVAGDEATLTVVNKGETHIGEYSSTLGGYVLADFDSDDYAGFLSSNEINNLKLENGAISYTQTEFGRNGIKLTLPEKLVWEDIYELKVRFKDAEKKDSAWVYLYDESGYSAGVYVAVTWWGGVTKIEDDGDGWKIATVTPEAVVNVGGTDNGWQGKWADKIKSVVFSSQSEGYFPSIDYVIYTLRDPVDNVAMTYDGEELKNDYLSTDVFDWRDLKMSADSTYYDATYTLTKDGLTLEMLPGQRLEAGDYVLTGRLKGTFGGKAVHSFTVTHSDAVIPERADNVVFEGGTLSWDEAENAESYLVTVEYASGEKILTKTVTETSTDLTLTGGKLVLSVTSVSSEGILGDMVSINYLSLGQTHFGEEGTTIADSVVVADFDSVDYKGFISSANDYTVADGALSYTSVAAFGTVLTYELPEAIDFTKVYQLKIRYKNDNASFIFGGSGGSACVFVKDGWIGYGVAGIVNDGDWKIATFTADSLSNIDNKSDNTWADMCVLDITRIGFASMKAEQDITVDYIGYIETVPVADFDVTYDGAALKDEYDTFYPFMWEKLAAESEHGTHNADFTLLLDGSEVEMTERQKLEAGSYTLKITLKGVYIGEKEIPFTVKTYDGPVPETITGLVNNGGTLEWNADDGAVSYNVILVGADGKIIKTDNVATNSYVLPAGKYTVKVSSVISDYIEGEASELEVTELGDTNFGAETARKTKTIADFNSEDYLGFTQILNGATVDVTGGTLKIKTAKAWSGAARFNFPAPVNASEIAEIRIRATDGTIVTFYDENCKTATAFITSYAGWTGLKSTVRDGDMYLATITWDSLASGNAEHGWSNNWTDMRCDKITAIDFGSSDTNEKLIDFVEFVTPLDESKIAFKSVDSATGLSNIASFNDAEYMKLMTAKSGVNFSVADGVLKFKPTGTWGDSVYFDLPQPIDASEIVEIRFKATKKTIIKFFDETGKAAWAYNDYAGATGIKSVTAEGSYVVSKITWDSLTKASTNDGAGNNWTDKRCNKIKSIALGVGDTTAEISVDYISFISSETVVETGFNKQVGETNEYTLVDFNSATACKAFMTGYAANGSYTISDGTFNYIPTNAWSAVARYDFAQKIDFSIVAELKIRFKGTGTRLTFVGSGGNAAVILSAGTGWAGTGIAKSQADGEWTVITLTYDSMSKIDGNDNSWASKQVLDITAITFSVNKVDSATLSVDCVSVVKKSA